MGVTSLPSEGALARIVQTLTEPEALLQWGLACVALLLRKPLRGGDPGWRGALRQRVAVPLAVVLVMLAAVGVLAWLDRPRGLRGSDRHLATPLTYAGTRDTRRIVPELSGCASLTRDLRGRAVPP